MSGNFRSIKDPFTMVCNSVIEDKNLSLKAKGLYLMIKHYITIPGFVLNKGYLQSISTDGERSFESGWKELKEAGYLIQYRLKGSDGKWIYEYELLHEPLKEDKKDKEIIKKPTTGKVADYNNSIKKELENKKDSYNINSNKNSIPQNQKSNNKKLKTRYHNIPQTYENYGEEELEQLLLESQKGKFEFVPSYRRSSNEN